MSSDNIKVELTEDELEIILILGSVAIIKADPYIVNDEEYEVWTSTKAKLREARKKWIAAR